MMIGVLVAAAVAVVGAVMVVQGQLSQPAYANTQATTNDNAAVTESFVKGERPVASTEEVAQAGRPYATVVSKQVVTPRTRPVTYQNRPVVKVTQTNKQVVRPVARPQAAAATNRPQTRPNTATNRPQTRPYAGANRPQVAGNKYASHAARAAAVEAAPADAFTTFETAFVAADSSFNDISAAQEQAVQNVIEEEEVLSPSAPTL